MRTTTGSLPGTSPTPLSLPVLIRRWLIVAIATSLFGVGLSAVAGSFDAEQASSPQVLSAEEVADPALSAATTPIESPISTAPTDRPTVAPAAAAAETNATDAPAATDAPTTTTPGPETTEPEAAADTTMPETDSSLPADTIPGPTTTVPVPTTVTPTTTVAPPTTSTTEPTPTTTVPEATTTTAAPPAPSSGTVDTAFASELVAKANHARSSEGIGPLSVSSSLTAYATAWASNLADTHSLSHSNIGSLLGAWSTVGENVAAGHPSAQAMHNAWMGSTGHRANILNPSFTHIGVGVVIDDNGTPRGVEVFGG